MAADAGARRRSGAPWAVLGTALMALGAGAVLVAVSTGNGPVLATEVGPVNPGAGDPLDITAHNSPTVVADPRRPANLAVTSRVDTPQFSCRLHVSSDAGDHWRPVSIPFPAGEEAPPRCFAPDAAFGADGTLYVSFVTLRGAGNVPNAAWLSRSTDGGKTLSTPAPMLGQLAFGVRLVADPKVPGRLHVTWLQAAATATLGFPDVGYPVLAARSEDGGATWAEPVTVSPPSRARVLGAVPAVASEEGLYVAYLDLGDDALDYHGGHEGRGGEPYPGRWSLVVSSSRDGGKSWSDAVVDAGIVPIERVIAFFPPTPSIAVDGRTGRVHVAFHDGRAGDPDVWLWSSTDGGATFGAPRRVNDTRRGDGTSQYLPRISVAPAGRVDVVYYDRRRDRRNVRNDVSLQSSSDGGRSFGPSLRISGRSFDSRIGFGSERGMPDLGSRLGSWSGDDRLVAVWADTRAGNLVSNKQDLARAVVDFRRSPWRMPAAGAGAALVIAGIVVPVVARRRRRVGQPTSDSSPQP